VGRGPERAQEQGMPKKTPRPRPFSRAGRGKGPGARVFRGPARPVMNSKSSFEDRLAKGFHKGKTKTEAHEQIEKKRKLCELNG